MSINLGNNTNVKFRVGSADCKVYLGTNLLYPNSSPIPYENQYLTFVAKGQEEYNSYQFSGNSINYSLDSGATWSTLQSGEWTPTIPSGHTIMWKATLTPSSVSPNYGIGTFKTNTSLGFIDIEGNIMSLLYGDNFIGQTDLSGKDYAFYKLFYTCNGSRNASNLILPATTLSDSCYADMFDNCSLLETAPELPATTLANNCYYSMFLGCTSLTTAPELPATTLANYCYDIMFYRCTSLTTAPELPATTLAKSCYHYMFYGCTSLTTAPTVLPATTLADNCYADMFRDCSALKKGPEISGTTFGSNSYVGMFSGCVSMTKGPSILPATTLTSSCYRGLFSGCTSLEASPILPAERLLGSCYRDMFRGCTNLKRVTCLAIDKSASYCTDNWLFNVAENGTFIKNSAASWGTGVNAVPITWTVQNYTT